MRCRVDKETGTGERWVPATVHGLSGHHTYGNHQQLWCSDSLSRCGTRHSCILNACPIRTQGCWMPCCPTKWTTMVTLTPELTHMAGRVRLPWKQPGRFVETGSFFMISLSLNDFFCDKLTESNCVLPLWLWAASGRPDWSWSQRDHLHQRSYRVQQHGHKGPSLYSYSIVGSGDPPLSFPQCIVNSMVKENILRTCCHILSISQYLQ